MNKSADNLTQLLLLARRGTRRVCITRPSYELFTDPNCSVWYFYIETRYTPLEEITKHFDGDDAILGGAAATDKGRQLAAEMGGLDTVNMDEKTPRVEHNEL